ncbi:hypothetical protein MRB53_018934 [Persea americana]|uniref:Uncharacterized protein n=1 Tax=Persea americana TaxID=3435 RepID=A0ACC2M9B7_PERAE|nr:hypothetical protein MRB53_018934 [Persea americana]
MEGLRVADADLVVYIHPSKANKIKQAVLRQLSSALLFQFNENFDGVVLAYDEQFQSNKAKITPGIVPNLGVKLKAKLLLFSPKPDMLLEGKVVKLGKESIHVIVLGFSSAAITFEDIREEFKYKTKHGESVFASMSHKRHVIKVGSMIRFLVKRSLKKQREKDLEVEMQEQDTRVGAAFTSSILRHKSKRKRTAEES